MDNDSRTQYTANDALMSKYSSCLVGYSVDPYVADIVESQCRVSEVKKPPIINRGYFARDSCIKSILRRYLENTINSERQIVCLGAGMDTSSFNLVSEGHPNLKICEVDFPVMITRKVDYIISRPNIVSLLMGSSESNVFTSVTKESSRIDSGYRFGNVTFLSHDLRNGEKVVNSLLSAGFDPHVPTLIITECVLVYIERTPVTELLTRMGQTFSQAAWVSYDMINPDDAFGRVMQRNLTAARFRVPGFKDYPNLSAQQERYLSAGFQQANSVTMYSAYENMISTAEKTRIARLEIFDEVEEWQLIMNHYALTLAVQGELLLTVFPSNTLTTVYDSAAVSL